MTDKERNDDEQQERKEEATDPRTLSDLESEKKISPQPNRSAPSPDSETDPVSGDEKAGDPM